MGQFSLFLLKILYVQISINGKRQYTVHGGNRLWTNCQDVFYFYEVYIYYLSVYFLYNILTDSCKIIL